MNQTLSYRSVRINDALTLHLEGTGEPTCLMLHGLGYASWEAVPLRESFDSDFGFWSLDNRGTGRSGYPRQPYSIEQLAEDAAQAIGELGQPLVVIGHSMGGYIAQRLAEKHPEKVRGLILIGTSPGGAHAEPVPASTLRLWDASAGLPAAEYARRTMPLSFPPGWVEAHPGEFEGFLTRRLAFPTPQEVWRAQFSACQEFLSRGIDPRLIAVRTLVVHGTADRVVPVGNGRLLSKMLPHADYFEVPGAGHLVHLEDPGLLAGRIAEFVNHN